MLVVLSSRLSHRVSVKSRRLDRCGHVLVEFNENMPSVASREMFDTGFLEVDPC